MKRGENKSARTKHIGEAKFLFCIDITRRRRGRETKGCVYVRRDDSQHAVAQTFAEISPLDVAPHEKKSDRVYVRADSATRRDARRISRRVRNYGSHAERGPAKRLRGRRGGIVAKELTEFPAGGESISRRGSRQNFPAATHRAVHPARYRDAPKGIRGSKTDYIPVSNGGDTSHSFTAIYAGRASRDTCFSGELTVDDELTAVNNIVAVNRG